MSEPECGASRRSWLRPAAYADTVAPAPSLGEVRPHPLASRRRLSVVAATAGVTLAAAIPLAAVTFAKLPGRDHTSASIAAVGATTFPTSSSGISAASQSTSPSPAGAPAPLPSAEALCIGNIPAAPDSSRYQGLSSQQAEAQAKGAGLIYRVVGQDGVCDGYYADFRQRLDVYLQNGIVEWAGRG